MSTGRAYGSFRNLPSHVESYSFGKDKQLLGQVEAADSYGHENKSTLADGMVGELATHLGKARERLDALSIMSFFRGNGRQEICGNERRSPESSPGATLPELALQYQDHHCSMLHDRIYALRALAVDSLQLKPDYSKTPLDLLADVHTDGKNAPLPYPKNTKRLCQLLEFDFSDTIELDIITQPQQPPNHLFTSETMTSSGEVLGICEHCIRALNKKVLNKRRLNNTVGRTEGQSIVARVPGRNFYVALSLNTALVRTVSEPNQSGVWYTTIPDESEVKDLGTFFHCVGAITASDIQDCRQLHFYNFPGSTAVRCTFLHSSPGKVHVQFSSWTYLHNALFWRWRAEHERACLNHDDAYGATSLKSRWGTRVEMPRGWQP